MNFRTRKNEDVRMFVKIVVSHDERSKNQQKKKRYRMRVAQNL